MLEAYSFTRVTVVNVFTLYFVSFVCVAVVCLLLRVLST